MKKTILSMAIILGITISSFAQGGGGVFGYGDRDAGYFETRGENDGLINLPSSHGSDGDSGAPLGSGALLLIGFGAAYALKRQRNK